MPLHRNSTVKKIAIYHCFRSSSSLRVNFSRGLFIIRGGSMYSTCNLVSLESRCFTHTDFPLWLIWSVFKGLQSRPVRWRNSMLCISDALLCVSRVLFPCTYRESKYKEWASLLTVPGFFPATTSNSKLSLQGILWAPFTSFCASAVFLPSSNSCN